MNNSGKIYDTRTKLKWIPVTIKNKSDCKTIRVSTLNHLLATNTKRFFFFFFNILNLQILHFFGILEFEIVKLILL